MGNDQFLVSGGISDAELEALKAEIAEVDPDPTMAADSNERVATQHATKTADIRIASVRPQKVDSEKWAVPYFTATNNTTQITTKDMVIWMPIDLYEAQSFSAIGFTVAIKGEGTALVARLGVRADDGTGTKPGALIKDYGTVSVESTGEKTISVTQSYGPGRIWIGIVIQGTALTVGPTLNGIATYGGTTRGVDTLGNTSQRALKVSGITGVFGAEPGTIERVALAPLLGLKAA